MTTRAPRRKVGHLTRPGYRAGNSPAGDAWAKRHGYLWVDRDLQMTADRTPINTHWPRASHDRFVSQADHRRWAGMTVKQATSLTSPDGFGVRTMYDALTSAHELGLNVEIEAKCFVSGREFRAIARHARRLWGKEWRRHVEVKCLTTIPGWQHILKNAHHAGFHTIALARGRQRFVRIDSPYITYVRGSAVM